MDPRALDPTSVDQLKETFAVLKKPQNFKEFGQNFLIDGLARDAIVAAARVQSSDLVLEIGPGSGVLTQKLVALAKRVVAIDIDPYLLEVTRIACNDAKNLELKLQDVRKINLPALFDGQDYLLVSNVPYYLTGYLLELFTESTASPKRMVLTLQKEVADRILAPVGEHSVLSISMAIFGRAQLVREIPRNAFWPEPTVDSAVVLIERHAEPFVDPAEKKKLMRLIKAGFSARRKKLANALAGGLQRDVDEVRGLLEKAGFSQNARAQELTLEKWAQLSKIL